ncbi:VOC family protein [Mycolicibacterium alvei]|uniref:VOC family protein n=1 Tax=Mycolicibacterium alvei TaxID=67081 RepID=UPI0013D2542A|nr:VOC family protein [Mycolicibacterium alvei]
MKQSTEQTQTGCVATAVASAVMRVSDLDRSVKFYRDVFCCSVALRERDSALLLTPDGFQLYLHTAGSYARPGLGVIGIQYLMWTTDSQAELDRVTARLQAHDPATYTYTENGVTFVEGCDPDHGRAIVAYPSPDRLPRELIASRLRGVVQAGARAGAARRPNKTAAQSR